MPRKRKRICRAEEKFSLPACRAKEKIFPGAFSRAHFPGAFPGRISPARKGVFRKLKQAPQNPTRKQMKTEPDYEKSHYATTE